MRQESKNSYIEKKDNIWRMKINAKNHYESGYKHGELLLKAKHPLLKLIKRKPIQIIISILYKIKRKEFRKLSIPKKYEEELRGLSDSTKIPYKVLFFINFAFDVYKRNIMCSSFAFFNKRETIIGRSTDTKEPLAKLLLKYEASIVTRTTIKNKTFTHVIFPLVIGVLNGYNEQGIVTNPHLINGVKNGKLKQNTTPIILLLNEIMENANNIAQAKKILQEKETTRAVTVLVTSSKEKKSFIYETHPEKTAYIHNKENYQACTMHFDDEEMKKLQKGPLNGTKKRLKYLNKTLQNTKEMSLTKAKETLRSTQHGIKRTKSGGKSISNLGTFQSFIFIPEKNKIYYSNGQKVPVSITGEYKEIEF